MGHVARFIFPSIADIFFLVLFWALLAGGLSSRPLADADIGWLERLISRRVPLHRAAEAFNSREGDVKVVIDIEGA